MDQDLAKKIVSTAKGMGYEFQLKESYHKYGVSTTAITCDSFPEFAAVVTSTAIEMAEADVNMDDVMNEDAYIDPQAMVDLLLNIRQESYGKGSVFY